MAQIDGINTPPRGVLAQYMVLKIAERLPLVSGPILDAANAGEPYELLVRQIKVLHLQLVELSSLAERAKMSQSRTLEAPKINDQDPAHKTPDSSSFTGSVEIGCGV